MKKPIFLLIALLCIMQVAKPQSSSSEGYKSLQPQIMPLSPNAAALSIFTDYPISHYTGLPNINLPLHEVTIDDFKLPITLNYHSSGIKVDQEASWVGLGWNLNIGGQISRSVKCFDDFLENPAPFLYEGYYNGPEADDPLLSSYYLQTNGNPILVIDSEPDVFYYSFPGGSGKFLLDKSRGVVLLEKNPAVKVEVLNNDLQNKYFVITIPDGTKYEYANREQTSTYSEKGSINQNGTGGAVYDEGENRFQTSPTLHISTWNLTKITTKNNREILFEYTRKIYKSPVQEACMKYNMIASQGTAIQGMPPLGAPIYSKSKTVTNSFMLQKIAWDNGSICFETSSRNDMIDADSPTKLDAIKVLDKNNNLIKGIKFNYGYFNENYSGSYGWVFKRLKLTSVSDLTQTNIKHTFSYYNGDFPAKNSLNKDWWGYSNGKNYGRDAYSECYAANSSGQNLFMGVNKTSNINYLKIGILNSITYPTGDKTEFTYEGNCYDRADIGGHSMTNVIKNFETYHTAEQNQDNSIRDETKIDRYEFTILLSTSVKITGKLTSFKHTNPYHSAPTNWQYDDRDYPMATLKRTSPTVATISVYTTPFLSQIQYPYMDRTLVLEPGTYVFEAISPVMDVLGEWRLEYSTIEETSPGKETEVGGGLRIAQIKTGSVIKNFEYSTGKLLVKPVDGYIEEQIITLGTKLNISTYLIQLSSSTIPLSSFRNGNAVGYDWVKESVSDENGTATTKYTFHNDKEGTYNPEDPFFPADISYSNGLIKEIAYLKGNTLVKNEKFEYQTIDRERPVYAFLYHPNSGSFTSYEYDVQWWNKSRQITETYSDTNAAQKVTEDVTYLYNDNGLPTTTRTLINNKVQEKRIAYPTDFTDVISNKMKANYQIGIPIETVAFNDYKVISATKTSYRDTLGLCLPKTVYTLNTATPLPSNAYESCYVPDYHYDRYNEYGKVLQIRQNDANITYLWSYNGEYPIAEIKNATYRQVESVLPGNFIATLCRKREPSASDVSTVNSLRTQLPGAHITTYTYKPLVGILTENKPNGEQTTYTYDSLQRLQSIKDHANKTVETYEYHYKP